MVNSFKKYICVLLYQLYIAYISQNYEFHFILFYFTTINVGRFIDPWEAERLIGFFGCHTDTILC